MFGLRTVHERQPRILDFNEFVLAIRDLVAFNSLPGERHLISLTDQRNM